MSGTGCLTYYVGAAMDDHPSDNMAEPDRPAKPGTGLRDDPSAQTAGPHAAYLKLIDKIRKIVAIGMVVFGVGFAVCVRRNDYLRGAGLEPGTWAWGGRVCGIGALACLALALGLIVEHLARPAAPRPFFLRSVLVRSLFILIAMAAVIVSMNAAYGPWQAIGAAMGIALLLDAVREHGAQRAALGISASIMFGLTLWGTQSAYQYARRHADDIVTAGCELADRCPRTSFYAQRPYLGKSGTSALVGQEIDPSDPRVPDILRRLGAKRIWVDEQRVAVYVGGDTEFQIYRTPYPKKMNGPVSAPHPVWAPQWKGSTRFNDRLWTNVY